LIAEPDRKSSGNRVDLDDIAVLEEADRPADRGLGADMADAEAARAARETAVGDQGDLLADTLAI
jgi:hypothetical protein